MKCIELTRSQIFDRLQAEPHKSRQNFLAMYSSWYGGVTKDPELMLLPIDDHMVHRGDGIFEAIKCQRGQIYGLQQHLERMQKSADFISLKPIHTLEEIRSICLETVRIAKADTCLIRIYLSRGPGTFGHSPYEVIAGQLYVVVTNFAPLPEEKYQNGVSAKISKFRVKEGFFPKVKSCNYLQNVLMKKEAIDAGVEFTISFDEQGFLAEGGTENFAVIKKNGELHIPGFERTLKGVTVSRIAELAQQHLVGSMITGVHIGPLKLEEAIEAKEMMFLATTFDCLPVVEFSGHRVGDGKVGPVYRKLRELLNADMGAGPMLTPVY